MITKRFSIKLCRGVFYAEKGFSVVGGQYIGCAEPHFRPVFQKRL
jgi:hypothetical protein